MTREQDIERVLDQWFAEGPTQMPSRFLDDTLERIDRAPQHRLARLQTRLPTMTVTARRAAVAAVMVIAIGAGAGVVVMTRAPGVGGQPTPTSSPDATATVPALQSLWEAVGDRQSPGDWGVDDNSFNIDSTGLRIEQVHGDVLSTLSLTDGGTRIVLTFRHGITGPAPTNQQWPCQVGDEGIYTVRLTADGRTLTLGLVSDPCVPRAAFLPGDWTRSVCESGYLACQPEPSATATAQRVEFPGFLPFGPGTTGTFSAPVGIHTVTWIGPDSLQLVNPFGPPSPVGDSSIYIVSGILPGFQPPSGGCAAPFAGTQRTPAALVAWIQTFASLEVSSPQPITVGGLPGVVVDITERVDATKGCGDPRIAGSRIEILAGGSWLTASSRLRLILLDRGDGESILIDVGNRGQPTWDSVDAAMSIVNAFEFRR